MPYGITKKSYDDVFENDKIVKEDVHDYLLEKHKGVYENDKEGLELATEAVSELKKVSKSVVSSNRGNVASETSIVGDGFTRRFIQEGYIELRGAKVQNVSELAEVMQVYRDPRFETFRIVYMKGDKIVATEGISSRMPGFSKWARDGHTEARVFSEINRRIQRLGSDGYYLVHNHPAGDIRASSDDFLTTLKFRRNVKGFKEHLILGYTEG